MIPTGSAKVGIEPADVASVGGPAEAENAIGAAAVDLVEVVRDALERLAQTTPLSFNAYMDGFERLTGLRLERGTADDIRSGELPFARIQYVAGESLFVRGGDATIVAKVDEVWLYPKRGEPLLIHLSTRSVEVRK